MPCIPHDDMSKSGWAAFLQMDPLGCCRVSTLPSRQRNNGTRLPHVWLTGNADQRSAPANSNKISHTHTPTGAPRRRVQVHVIDPWGRGVNPDQLPCCDCRRSRAAVASSSWLGSHRARGKYDTPVITYSRPARDGLSHLDRFPGWPTPEQTPASSRRTPVGCYRMGQPIDSRLSMLK